MLKLAYISLKQSLKQKYKLFATRTIHNFIWNITANKIKIDTNMTSQYHGNVCSISLVVAYIDHTSKSNTHSLFPIITNSNL